MEMAALWRQLPKPDDSEDSILVALSQVHRLKTMPLVIHRADRLGDPSFFCKQLTFLVQYVSCYPEVEARP